MSTTLPWNQLPLSPKDRIIVRLDPDDPKETARLIHQLREYVGGFRIGPLSISALGIGAYLEASPALVGHMTVDFEPRTMPASVENAGNAFDAIGTMTGKRKRETAAKAGILALETVARKMLFAFGAIPEDGHRDVYATYYQNGGILSDEEQAVARLKVMEWRVVALDKAGFVAVTCNETSAIGIVQQTQPDMLVIGSNISVQEAMIAGADLAVIDLEVPKRKNPLEAAKAAAEEIAGCLVAREAT